MNISQQNSHHSATLPISLSHSFIPLACAEFDDSLPFSGASSIPLYHALFPATLLHQLFFHPLSPRLAIYFLAYLSNVLLPNSYIIYNTCHCLQILVISLFYLIITQVPVLEKVA